MFFSSTCATLLLLAAAVAVGVGGRGDAEANVLELKSTGEAALMRRFGAGGLAAILNNHFDRFVDSVTQSRHDPNTDWECNVIFNAMNERYTKEMMK
jgi:hypothetical protein